MQEARRRLADSAALAAPSRSEEPPVDNLQNDDDLCISFPAVIRGPGRASADHMVVAPSCLGEEGNDWLLRTLSLSQMRRES